MAGMTKGQLDDLRRASDEFDRAFDGMPDDEAAQLHFVNLMGYLAANAGVLLDEIARLRAERPEPAPVCVKYDGRGGSA